MNMIASGRKPTPNGVPHALTSFTRLTPSRDEEYHSFVRKNIVSELNWRVERGPRKRNFLILDDDSVLDPEACRAMLFFWRAAGNLVVPAKSLI